MSIRNEKIASTLLRAIQRVVADGLQDPRTEGSLLTVLGLELSPDGHNASVRVSVLPEANESKCIAALKHSSAYIRREAGELVDMRALPQLDFVLDRSLKKQAGVMQAMSEINKEREQHRQPAPPHTPPPSSKHP